MIILIAFCFFVAGPFIGWILYMLFSSMKGEDPEPVIYGMEPAGYIHLFDGDRKFYSGPFNPYEHKELNWIDGKIGCALSCELEENPEYKPALIGTITVLKPERDRGIVAVILDNEIIDQLGLPRAGLVSGAQMLVDAERVEASLPREIQRFTG